MTEASHNNTRRLRRANRVRNKLAANTELPRLSVHRTLRHIYAQVIDDTKGKVLACASDLTITTNAKTSKTDIAKQVGLAVAEKAKAAKVTAVRFDRGSFRYHGRVAALADAAREAGLTF
jgi:large subunit ribosomal protein L18